MKIFLKNFFLFFIPVVVYLVLVYFIDPYNLINRKNGLISNDIKYETAYKLNYPLYKLIAFDKKSTEYILLGDSRVENLGTKYFDKYSGHKFTNLAYGGGTLIESINTFWEIVKKHKLNEVYFGLNFDSYNATFTMDRVSEAIDIKNNFLKYAFSKYTIKSQLLIVKSELFNKKNEIGKPKQTKDDFWDYQINTSAKNMFRIYKYPENYFLELKKISDYCKNNKIKLIFFSPPTHVDLQNKIKKYNLLDKEIRFKEDLRSLGTTVYDFDYKNELTSDRSNFIDPFHIQKEKSKIIVKDLFSPTPVFAEFSKIE